MRRSPYHLTAPQRRREPCTGSPSVLLHDSHRVVAQHEASLPPIWVPTHSHRYANARSFAQDNERHGVSTHIHPILQQQMQKSQQPRPASSSSSRLRMHGTQSQLSQPQGLTASVLHTLRDQLYRILSALHRKDILFDDTPSSSKRPWSNNILWVILPVLVVITMASWRLVPLAHHKTNSWSRLESRHLGGRKCVMNLFIDKQPPDEYNPDYVDPSKQSAPTTSANINIKGTYRTKGQLKVISRFISSVADSFRSNTRIQQHVIFAGTRDGGHLAEEALKHWPARGVHRTQLHIFAAPPSDALEYDTIEDIENRFDEFYDNNHIHLYDAHGNLAGDLHEEDNEETSEDDESPSQLLSTNKKDRRLLVNEHNATDLQSLLFPDEEDLDDNIVFPYMHIDGTSMEQQLEILQRASPLLDATKIVVVAIEHAPDMDIQDMIDFFRSKNYKTFMLGLRQLTRIDNLCPELLENMLEHPAFDAAHKQSATSWLPWLTSVHTIPASKYPPYFVAMPKGRQSKQEMTIQHMYDLFSGSGGGGQVKTANDRKAPGK